MATADAVFTRARDRSDKDRRIIESEPVRRVHRLPQIRLTSATRDRSDQDRRITDSVCDGFIVVDRSGGFSFASETEATKTAGSLRESQYDGSIVDRRCGFHLRFDRSYRDRRITDSVCDGSIVVDRRGGFSSASVTEATKTAGSLRASATGPAVTADAVFNCAHDRSEVE